MKRLTAILILAFVSVALFADVPFTAELAEKLDYFAKTDNEGDISHYKTPKPQIVNARRLLDYDIACEPTWF